MNIFSLRSYFPHRFYGLYFWSIIIQKPFVFPSVDTNDPSHSYWFYPLWIFLWFHWSSYWKIFWCQTIAQSRSSMFCFGLNLYFLGFAYEARWLVAFYFCRSCPDSSSIYLTFNLLDLLLQLLDYPSILDLSLHKTLLYNTYLLLQAHTSLFPILDLASQISAFLMVVVGCKIGLTKWSWPCWLIRLTFLSRRRRRFLRTESTISIQHLCQLRSVRNESACYLLHFLESIGVFLCHLLYN